MYQRARLAVLSASHVVDDLYQGAVPALVALLVIERHYTYAAAAGITLAATVLSSVAQPVFGLLTDRREMHWMVPAGLGVAGLGIGLSGLTDSYALTWAAVALSGLGVAAYHPQAARSARIAGGGTATGMSIFAVGGNLGFAIGPAATTAVLLSTGLGGTPLLVAPALAMVVVLVVLQRRQGGPIAAPARSADAGTDRWGPFALLSVAVVMRSILFFGLSTLIALFLRERFGAGPAVGSAALTTLLAVGTVSTIVGGRLADRIGRVPTIRIGYLLALPGLAGLLLAPSVTWAFVATAVLGVATYLPFSVQTTLAQDYLPTRVGTASGVTLGLAVSVGGVFTPVLGAIGDSSGLGAAILVLAVAPVVALVICFRLPEIRSTTPASAPAGKP
ncbi:MFS transporter [Pseudonocardia sp. GCM10023141]|uniref:MFS transporter n=1 Tax=Pseudonocardia sp. GCM10023141 TaxID=3252653 RepID=UPI003618F297